jgi:hypothetical protein
MSSINSKLNQQAACTLVSPSKDYLSVLQLLRSTPYDNLEVSGKEESWQSIRVELPSSELVFNSMIYERRADKFSKLVNQMHVYFDQPHCGKKNDREKTLKRILATKMLIGTVGEPELSDECCERISFLAKKLGAMVFTGNALVEWDGSTLLERKH